METKYDNTNKGVLFPNSYKKTEKHPDYVGTGNYGGVDFSVSAWIRESKNGTEFLSLSIQEPKEKQ